MADFTDSALVLSSGQAQTVGAGNRIVLTNFKATGAVDFSGAALTGVATTGIADAVASISLDGSGNCTETSLVSINLTPSGAMTMRGGGISQFGDDVGYFAFDGAGALAFTAVTTCDIDASGALQINSSAGAISLGNDAINQAISIATGGTRTLGIGTTTTTLNLGTGGGTATWTAIDNNAASVIIKSGADNWLVLDTRTGVEVFNVNCELNVDAGQGITVPLTGGAAMAIGDVAAVSGTSGKVSKADADSATAVLQNAVGINMITVSGDAQPASIAHAGVVLVNFDGVIATTDHGKRCFLSATAGQATLTPPAPGGGAATVYQIGIVQLADGSTAAKVLLQMQYVSTILS